MSLHLLSTGTLFKDPKQLVSKSGRPFATATLKCGTGDEISWIKIVAFDQAAQAELLRLRAGDALSAQGACKVSIYAPQGAEPRANIDLVASIVTALRQTKKPRVDAPENSSKLFVREAADA
jgi:single-stranded DNA-binding protein